MKVILTLFLAGVLGYLGDSGSDPNHTPPAGMTCPGDKLVWVNTRSHIYHFKGERYFGSTKEGKVHLRARR
jgi:hypothetical protein